MLLLLFGMGYLSFAMQKKPNTLNYLDLSSLYEGKTMNLMFNKNY